MCRHGAQAVYRFFFSGADDFVQRPSARGSDRFVVIPAHAGIHIRHCFNDRTGFPPSRERRCERSTFPAAGKSSPKRARRSNRARSVRRCGKTRSSFDRFQRQRRASVSYDPVSARQHLVLQRARHDKGGQRHCDLERAGEDNTGAAHFLSAQNLSKKVSAGFCPGFGARSRRGQDFLQVRAFLAPNGCRRDR